MEDLHQMFMKLALEQAEQAYAVDEVPVGAIIAHQGRVIAAAHNQREQLKDPTAHAEMIAITQAAESMESWRLSGCVMYVTLEPCPMCAGAILNARIPKVVFGASDPKGGAVTSVFKLLSDARMNHRSEITHGIMAERCGEILGRFFRSRRNGNHGKSAGTTEGNPGD